MSNQTNRDGRVTSTQTLKRVRRMLSEMVERTSYKATSRAIGWNPNPVHAIVLENDFTQKVLYPEDVEALELVHDVVMHYEDMSDDARKLADVLIEQAHEFVKTARQLRRVLRHM